MGSAAVLTQRDGKLEISTRGRGLVDVTRPLAAWLEDAQAGDGLLHVFLRHTSASLLIQENADPTVRADLERFFAALVPDGDPRFEHDAEGPDDMPAHVRAALTACELTVPVRKGRLALGTWQAVYVYEHRRAPHTRGLTLTFQGTAAP